LVQVTIYLALVLVPIPQLYKPQRAFIQVVAISIFVARAKIVPVLASVGTEMEFASLAMEPLP
jgi:hypothetical protein